MRYFETTRKFLSHSRIWQRKCLRGSFWDNLEEIILQNALLVNLSVWKWFWSYRHKAVDLSMKRFVHEKGMALSEKIHAREYNPSLCPWGEEQHGIILLSETFETKRYSRAGLYSCVYAAKEITRHSHFSAFRGVISASWNTKSCWN